jgi:hypothetical protein
MLVTQKINNSITAYGKPSCDRCIVDALHLPAHTHSAQITAALVTTSDFTRKRAELLSLQEREAYRPFHAGIKELFGHQQLSA